MSRSNQAGLRVVVLGDVVGTPGRRAVIACLPEIRRRWEPDLVVVNGENAAKGSGLTPEMYHKLREAGVDGVTLGDHAFRKQQILPVLGRDPRLIRPANLAPGARGRGWMRLTPPESDGPAVYVVVVLGRLFMHQLPANDPFATVDAVLAELPEPDPIVLVEVHAEATSEKVAMGWHLSGRVAAVYGTHTHVATADARILPVAPIDAPPPADGVHRTAGTAYITDLGMCGPHDSVLGRRTDRVLTHMTTAMPAPFDVASGNPRVNGVCLTIDPATRRATAIERIELAAELVPAPEGSE